MDAGQVANFGGVPTDDPPAAATAEKVSGEATFWTVGGRARAGRVCRRVDAGGSRCRFRVQFSRFPFGRI